MPTVAVYICRGLLAATLLGVGPALATEGHPAARKAFVQPAPSGAGCMNNSRLVSHVAYLPIKPEQTMQCGHLLSTDTLLTVHHWDRT